MGVFDYIRFNVPLPNVGLTDEQFQTKDTPAQWLNDYEVRDDGTLWHQNYERGREMRVSTDWVPEPFTGTIDFIGEPIKDQYIEYRAQFVDGKLSDDIVALDKVVG